MPWSDVPPSTSIDADAVDTADTEPTDRAEHVGRSDGTASPGRRHHRPSFLKRHSFWLWLVGIVAVGVFARLIALTSSALGPYEIAIVNQSLGSGRALDLNLLGSDVGPLTAYALSLFQTGQPPADAAALAAYRLPPMLFGIAAIILTALLGRQLFSERVGLVAAGLVAISIWAVRYSTLLTPIMIFTCWLLGVALVFGKIVRSAPRARADGATSVGPSGRIKRRYFLALGLLVGVGVFIGRFAWFVPAAAALCIALVTVFDIKSRAFKRRRTQLSFAATGAGFIGAVALLMVTGPAPTVYRPELMYGVSGYGVAFLDHLNLFALACCVGGGYLILKKRRREAAAPFALIGVFFFAFIFCGDGYGPPEMYMSALLPFLALAIGHGVLHGLDAFKRHYRPIKIMPVAILLLLALGDIGAAVPGLQPYAHHEGYRTGWYDACQSINMTIDSDDAILTDAPEIVEFYLPDKRVMELAVDEFLSTGQPDASEESEAEFGELTQPAQYLIVSRGKYETLSLAAVAQLESGYVLSQTIQTILVFQWEV